MSSMQHLRTQAIAHVCWLCEKGLNLRSLITYQPSALCNWRACVLTALQRFCKCKSHWKAASLHGVCWQARVTDAEPATWHNPRRPSQQAGKGHRP